jgi:hypothetical protein
MIQELSLTPSTAPLGFSPWFAGASIVLTGQVPASPDMVVWAAQLWRSQRDLIDDEAATPIAMGIGSVTDGVLTVGFTPSQVTPAALGLSREAGSNHYWLVVGGQDGAGNPQIVRGGTIEINPCPWTNTGLSNSVGITVANDWASFVYQGTLYRFAVARVTSPPITPDGIGVDDDNAYIDFHGAVFTTGTSEVTPTPPEAVEGELVVVNDTLIVLLDGIAYAIPVYAA